MDIEHLFFIIYPGYRLAFFITLSLLIYTKSPPFNLWFWLLGIYFILALFSFKLKNKAFQLVVLAVDISLSFYFSEILNVPLITVFSLPPLFASCFLTYPMGALFLLVFSVILDIKIIQMWHLAVVSHLSTTLASYLLLRESTLAKEKREKEKIEKDFREKLEIAKRLSLEFAHEIKNPLMNISAIIERIKTLEIPDKVREKLEKAEKEIDRMAKMASDFLKLEDYYIIKEKTNFADFLEKIKSRMPYANIEINCDKKLNLKIDKDKFEKALLNILQNSIEAKATEIKIEVKEKDKEVIIYISDNGTGIDESIKDKVFIPFFTTKETGTGLGLAIAKSIVENHNGEIKIKDKNTIEIRLPKDEGENSYS